MSEPSGNRNAGPIAGALFLVAGSLILWEILLTRIYSVVLFYHFAFMAVSVAMFGLTLGAVLAFLRVGPFSPADLLPGLGRLAAATGVLMAAAITLQLAMPLRFEGVSAPPLYLAATYLLSSLPFVPAGAFICLALTRFGEVGRLYAYDLAGAGLACAFFPILISWVGGPGAVLVAASLACLAGFLLLSAGGSRAWKVGILALGLATFAALNTQGGWLRIRFWHDGPLPRPFYETWNAFSRIMISPYPARPYGWGIDDEIYAQLAPMQQFWLEIDSGAGSPLTRFDGDLGPLQFLRYDVTSFAHHLRPGGKVYLIGPGGGRDILTGLVFGQEDILAVEVNRAIVDAVNGPFGDFTGHLDRLPGVRLLTGEGRGQLARADETFDIIQMSLVDTWAATAAGAFAFIENGLYTREAWDLFLDKLNPGGIVTVSRFYFGSADWPVEVYRSLALAAASVRARGAEDPGRHVMLIRTRSLSEPGTTEGIATILVSPDAFSEQDIQRADEVCREILCEVAWNGRESSDPNFARILGPGDPAPVYRSFPLDISPPTDDRPYFFFYARLGDVLRGRTATAEGATGFHLPAVQLLVTLMIIVLVLGAAIAVFPALWMRARGTWTGAFRRRTLSRALFFSAIGLAFMFVEIGLIQRLSLFLGHPTFGFTVVLAGLLLAGGAGSWASERVAARLGAQREWLPLAALVPVLLLMEVGSGLAQQHALSAPTPLRVLLALALILPPGFLMGFAFPLGMSLIQRQRDPRGPWYWAINGALSVVATVLAMILSLALGIRATLWTGTLLYTLATILLHRITHHPTHGVGS